MTTTEPHRRQISDPSVHLFGGKGGVGKTTCAAAFAAESAQRGVQTLVASTDPAHSLGDALGRTLGADPGEAPDLPGLSAVEIDADRAWRRWLAPRRATLAAIAERGTYFRQEDLSPLLELQLPGVDELLGLLEVLRLARQDGAELVVVDAAPTGHTLRLLEVPECLDAFASVLDAMEERDRVLKDAFGVASVAAPAASVEAEELIADLRRQARDLHALLRDPERASISWVLLAEPLAIAETESALEALAADGLAISELVVNRLASPDDACAAALGRLDAEAISLGEIERRFPEHTIRRLAESPGEPVGVPALLRLVAETPRPYSPEEPTDKPPEKPTEKPTEKPQEEPAEQHIPRRAGSAGILPAALVPRARLVLVGGKGGVGKSTCAAALALSLAQSSARTPDGQPGPAIDLVSTDPAPSLAHLFALDESPADPVRPDGAPPNLRVQEVDAALRFRQLRERLLGRLDRVTRRGDDRRGGSLPLERAVLENLVASTPPGLDELVALGELAKRLEEDGAPRIVVDLAPTGHSLRLLELPDLVLSWLRGLMKLLLDARQALGLGDLAEELLSMSRSVRRIQSLLRDPAQCVFVAVTRPAALPVAETRRLLERLGRLRISAPVLIVNAVLPEAEPFAEPCAEPRARQEKWISRLRSAAGERAILQAPLRFPRPAGVQSLTVWKTEWTTESKKDRRQDDGTSFDPHK